MGLLDDVAKLGRKSSDEAASGAARHADDSADEFVSNDEAAQNFGQETADGVNTGGGYVDFNQDGYFQRLGAQAVTESTNQVSRSVDSATGTIGTVAKVGGGTAVGLGTLYAGTELAGNYQDIRAAEVTESTYREYMERVEEIRNNDNLSAEEKEEALASAKAAYEAAIENADKDGNPTSDALADLLGKMLGIDIDRRYIAAGAVALVLVGYIVHTEML